MIIDIHTHVFPEHVALKAKSSLQQGPRICWFGDGTIDGLLSEMGRAGIDVSVLQPVATNARSVYKVNEWAGSLASDRIVAFGAIHPDTPDPGAEMDHMLSLGIRGLKLHPEFQFFEPAEPRMQPLFSAAQERGMTVLMHAGADPSSDVVRGNPESLAWLIDAYPDLNLVLAHLGGFQQWEGVREHLIGRDVYLDTAYTMGHLPDDEFVAMVREHGVERVMFGTDAPWTDSTRELAHMRLLGFSEYELDRMLFANAAELLGL